MWACASSLPNRLETAAEAQILCDRLAVRSGRSGTTPVCSKTTFVLSSMQTLQGAMDPGGGGPLGYQVWVTTEMQEQDNPTWPHGPGRREVDCKSKQPAGRLSTPKWSRAALLCIQGCSASNVSVSASSPKRQTSKQLSAVRGGCGAWFRCAAEALPPHLQWTNSAMNAAPFAQHSFYLLN